MLVITVLYISLPYYFIGVVIVLYLFLSLFNKLFSRFEVKASGEQQISVLSDYVIDLLNKEFS